MRKPRSIKTKYVGGQEVILNKSEGPDMIPRDDTDKLMKKCTRRYV